MIRITWVILLLSLVVLVAMAALLSKHLIKKATTLGVDPSQERKKGDDITHFQIVERKLH